jgi:hypothetical protein
MPGFARQFTGGLDEEEDHDSREGSGDGWRHA